MLRKVGIAASWRDGNELKSILPLPAKYQTQTIGSWFKDVDDFREWHKNLRAKYKLR